MRIKCNKIISPTTKEDLGDISPWLKRGHEYTVLAMNWSSKFGMKVFIQSEHYNEPCFVDLEGFEILSQKIPSSWITTTREFGDQLLVTMLPKSWTAYTNFFEELEDEKKEAVALFNEAVELIYREEGKV